MRITNQLKDANNKSYSRYMQRHKMRHKFWFFKRSLLLTEYALHHIPVFIPLIGCYIFKMFTYIRSFHLNEAYITLELLIDNWIEQERN